MQTGLDQLATHNLQKSTLPDTTRKEKEQKRSLTNMDWYYRPTVRSTKVTTGVPENNHRNPSDEAKHME